MLFLLSPAKNLDLDPAPEGLESTSPSFKADIKALSEITRNLSVQDLKDLMGISDNLATLNHERFQVFQPTGRANQQKPAALAFNGDVYQGLEANTLTSEQLYWAQDHLRILSGLYGLLRPLDMMQPYRLEMGTALETPRGKGLYNFWGDKISKEINKIIKGHTDGVVINLASNEYFKAVDKKALNAPVITPVFKEEKDGKQRVISFYAKKARGMMARWAIENKAKHPKELEQFAVAGYKFRRNLSDDKTFTFVRPQPPAKS